MRLTLRRLSASAALAGLLGCGGATGPFRPEVTNTTDSFQLDAADVTGLTTTLTYPWTNTGTRATVIHATRTGAGNAQLVLKDAAGTVVYDRPLAPTLNESTDAGAAGSWTVELRFTNFSGSINFLARKL